MLLNIPMPTIIPIAFFIVLMAASFYVGAYLEKREPRK